MGNSYLSNAMIPLMMTLVLGYYAARLLIFHDTESITGKDNGKKLKDKEKYVAESGKLILFLAAGSFCYGNLNVLQCPCGSCGNCGVVCGIRYFMETYE